MSLIGFVLLMLRIVYGRHGQPKRRCSRPMFNWSGEQLSMAMIGYGFVASVLPVWMLLAPRDYLSTFLKIGTILCWRSASSWCMPDLKMPALTKFHRRHGPGIGGQPVPVPLHHHRLRRRVGLSRADCVWNDAEDARQRENAPSSATADADGIASSR